MLAQNGRCNITSTAGTRFLYHKLRGLSRLLYLTGSLKIPLGARHGRRGRQAWGSHGRSATFPIQSSLGSSTRMCSSRMLRLRSGGRGIGHQIAGGLVLREGDDLADVGSSVRSITSRSMPGAMPPCGGAPYSKASSRWPNRSWICSSADAEHARKPSAGCRGDGCGCCRRRVRSRCRPCRRRRRSTAPGSVSSIVQSSSVRGMVKGWCIGVPALLFLVPFEQREIHHPGEGQHVRRRPAPAVSPAPAAARPGPCATTAGLRPPRSAAGRPSRRRRGSQIAACAGASGTWRRGALHALAVDATMARPLAP